MADKKKPEEELEEYIELDAEAPGTYDPNADKAACNAAGYFYCSVENKCLPKTLAEAAKAGSGGKSSSGSSSSSMAGKPSMYGMPEYITDFPAYTPFVPDDEASDESDPVKQSRVIPIGGHHTNSGVASTIPGHTGKPTGPPSKYTCDSACATPIPNYEGLTGFDEKGRLLEMRKGYESAKDCFIKRLEPACTKGLTDANIATMEDSLRGVTASLTTINNALLNLDDGVPTSRAELMSTFLGDSRDALSMSTRRTRPMGTIIQEVDTFMDSIKVSTTKPAKDFETNTPDDIKDPNYDGIKYTPSVVTDDVKYSKEHQSCLENLECTFDEFDHPEDYLTEPDIDLNEPLDVNISDEDITSGCANGTGLYDKLMTAIDSSIDLQFKNSRLDAKQFGTFYASAMTAAMQQTTAFLVDKQRLRIEAEHLVLEQNKYNLSFDKHKYDTLLAKVQAEKTLLEMEMFKLVSPLQLAKASQDAKLAEKTVELTTRKVESEEANTYTLYKNIMETEANGVLNRNLTEAKVEQTRVGIKTAKFDSILKKHQAYATKVQTAETKANGAASRRMTNAEIQSKNKQASLYDQQRKTYIHGQRQDTLKLLKDMWTIQIDTLGAEGMVIEALKGPELSSKIERHSLDTGL